MKDTADAVLEMLEQRTTARDSLPTKERLAVLTGLLEAQHQGGYGQEFVPYRREIMTVFTDVVCGVEFVSQHLEAMRPVAPSGAAVRGTLRELEPEFSVQWLVGRLEVLHGLLNRIGK